MAISVPYNPVPEATPAQAPIPEVHPAVVGEAFGQGIAQAVGGLGREVSHVGDQIFRRAVALQELQNNNEAKDLDTQFINEISGIHAKFNSLEGQDKVAALPQYGKDLEAARQKVLARASNDFVRKMAGSSMVGQVARHMFSGAAAAGEALKQATKASISANGEATKMTMLQDPNNEEVWAAGEAKLQRLHAEAADIHGVDPEVGRIAYEKDLQALKAARVKEIAAQEPFRAKELLEQYGTEQLGIHYAEAKTAIDNKTRDVTSRQIAAEQTQDLADNPNRMPEGGKTLGEREAAARKQAADILPDDPRAPEEAALRVNAIYNRQKQAVHNQNVQDYQTSLGIVGGLTTSGQLPTNMDEFNALATPEQQKAFQNLSPQQQLALQRRMAANAKLEANRPTEERQKNFERLLGMASRDPAQFLEQDLSTVDLTTDQMKMLTRERNNKIKSQTHDPRIAPAMVTLKPYMKDAFGLDRDAADRFRGQLLFAVREMEALNNAPLKVKDIEQVGIKLLTTQAPTKPWGDFFGLNLIKSTDRLSSSVPGRNEYIRIQELLKEALDHAPTEQEINNYHVMNQYLKLYPSQKKEAK